MLEDRGGQPVRKNRYDRIMDLMMTRIERVSDRMALEFKGTNPFDKEPVDKKQALFNWSTLDPEVQNQLRQTMGNEGIEDYLQKLGG